MCSSDLDMARLTSGDLELNFTGGVFGVHTGNRRTTSRLLAEEYPNVRKIIPTEFASHVTFEVDEWVSALQRAMLLDEQEYPRIKLDLNTDGVTLAGGQQGIGGLREDLTAEITGTDQPVWLNPRYLLDALRTVGSTVAVMHIPQDLRPVVIQPAGCDPDVDLNNLHMIMPVAGATG